MIDVTNVSVALGGRCVLKGVSLAVRTGERVGLIGPNGAGKSTLLRAVLGRVPVVSGTIIVDGEPVARARRRVGYVPQRDEFAWDFPITVAEAVLSALTPSVGWLRRPRRGHRAAVEEALDRVQLADLAGRPVGELSGGQRQRVLMARALARGPALFLLDEPFTGVDVPTQELLVDLLGVIAASGATVLMTTHDLAQAAMSSDRLCLLNRSVVAEGTPRDLDDPALWLRAFGVASSGGLKSILKGMS